MTIKEILKYIDLKNIAVFLIVFASLVEVTPLKINPWKSFWRFIQNLLGISEIQNKIVNIQETIDRNEAIHCRLRILRFSDEMYNNIHHSKEHFDQVLLDIDNYTLYCESHKEFKNGKTVNAIERINVEYKKCLDNKTFL
jgi:hypothetical protein